MDGTCDWPDCDNDSTEMWLTGPKLGFEYCADHIEPSALRIYPHKEPTPTPNADGEK